MTSLDKLKEIKEGWENYIFPNPEVEKIAEQRAVICASCPEFSGGLCGVCSCLLAAKTRSLKSKCPKDKWPNINIENDK